MNDGKPLAPQVGAPDAKVDAAAPVSAGPLAELASQLYSHAFQQISLLAIAAAGGALVMHQAGFFKTRPWTAVVAAVILALAALCSVIGSMELARGATEGVDVRKILRRLQKGAFFLLGAGTGVLIMGLLRNAFA
jgi:hypothetical protein